MVLWENVAYLVGDEQREVAFRALRERVGTKPAEILAARKKVLLEVARRRRLRRRSLGGTCRRRRSSCSHGRRRRQRWSRTGCGYW